MRPLDVVVRRSLFIPTSGAARLFPVPPTHTDLRRYGKQLPAEERSRQHRTAGRSPRGGPDEETLNAVEIAYGQAEEAISDFRDTLDENERREYTDTYSLRIVPFQN